MQIPKKNHKLKSIEGVFQKEMRNRKIKNEIDEIKKWENKIKRKDLKYERYICIYYYIYIIYIIYIYIYIYYYYY